MKSVSTSKDQGSRLLGQEIEYDEKLKQSFRWFFYQQKKKPPLFHRAKSKLYRVVSKTILVKGFWVCQFKLDLCIKQTGIELLNNKLHGLSPPGGFVSPFGGFASLLFDQAVPKNSQRHLADRNAICILHRSDCAWLCCLLSQ